MKCGFCGNELEHGAEVCPNCGMIISLGDEGSTENDKVVESVYNVFKSNVTDGDRQAEKAQELEADPTEEKVEFVMSLPEFDEASEPIKEEAAPAADASEPEVQENSAPAEADQDDFDIDMTLPEMEEVPLPGTLSGDNITREAYSVSADVPAEEIPETVEAVAVEEVTVEEAQAEEPLEVVEEVSAQEPVQSEEKLEIRVPESNYIYAEYDDYGKTESEEVKQEKNQKNAEAKKNLDMISPDEKKKPKAKKKNKKKGIDGIKIEAVLGVAIALIVILFGCAYAVKNDMIPVLGELFDDDTTTTQQAEESTEPEEDETTEEATTEEVTTEEVTTEEATTEEVTTTEPVTTEAPETTTEKETTTKETTTKETTTKPTTTKPTTTKPTTTKPTTTKPTTTRPTTTKPTTTRPTTTRPTTTRPTTKPTTKPTTTKPTTTKPTTRPSTTKPSTTKNPYGINDVKVKLPASYLSKSYTAYITAEGVTLRAKPAANGERILFLSKGADVKVLAKEGSFYYVKSNRYGVYGWVSATYVANERPQTEASTVKGTVAPDKKYDTVVTKYTINGLNIRKGPGTNYDVIGLIPISYPVKVIGYKSGVSGWVYVQDTTYGYTGWVSTAYIK